MRPTGGGASHTVLKARQIREQLSALSDLLPPTLSLAVLSGERFLAGRGVRDFSGGPVAGEQEGREALTLTDGMLIGHLWWSAPIVDVETARPWVGYLVKVFQDMAEAENVRRAVSAETLDAYRDLALLQRAVDAFTHSPKVEAIVSVLLKEFAARAWVETDCGAVLLRGEQSAFLVVAGTFGKNAAKVFSDITTLHIPDAWFGQTSGDIVSPLLEPLWWDSVQTDFASLLWMPIIAHGEHHGFLVLLSRQLERYLSADLKLARTLCPVAAAFLRNARLYAAQQNMFHSFIQAMSGLVDAKSHYTNGHCLRVQELSLLLADQAHRTEEGALADFVLEENERDALEIAALLHDCGKVVTPEWIMDKATRLEAIVDRIHLIDLRFELLRRDILIAYYSDIAEGQDRAMAGKVRELKLCQLEEDLAFLQKCNQGSEFISPSHVQRIGEIAGRKWCNAKGEELALLTDEEVLNLSIQRGTLNPQERKIMEDHARHTINVLSQIAFPPQLRSVTEYAGGHHERMDGRGYPTGLKGDVLSIPARILAIADIFEALTAPDRPYRQGGSLSWAINIMRRMKEDGHIDGELFDLFLSGKVYAAYAIKHLTASQIDLPLSGELQKSRGQPA